MLSRMLYLIHDLSHVFFLEPMHKLQRRYGRLPSFGFVDVDLVEHSGTLCITRIYKSVVRVGLPPEYRTRTRSSTFPALRP